MLTPAGHLEFHTHYQDTRFHKLNPLKIEPKTFGQHFGHGGFSDPGEIFNQQMSFGKQTGQGQAYLGFLAHQNTADLFHDGFKLLIHQAAVFPFFKKRVISILQNPSLVCPTSSAMSRMGVAQKDAASCQAQILFNS